MLFATIIENDYNDEILLCADGVDANGHTIWTFPYISSPNNIYCSMSKQYAYLFEGKNIWIFNGDFREYWVSEEKKKLINRQNKERLLLNFNRKISWIYPLDFARFEELIAELYEREAFVQSVRILGRPTCPDGGRDLMIRKAERVGENSYGTKLIIGQCKANKKSVGKRDITDIRDTIEHYDATGFYVFAATSLTAPLIDNLTKLKERYDIDWWTEREIFSRLRQHSDIADRYADIVAVTHDESAAVRNEVNL